MNKCSCFIGSRALWFWTCLCISIHKLLGPLPFCIWITSKSINVFHFSKVFFLSDLVFSNCFLIWSFHLQKHRTWTMQLLAVGCLSLAAKMEETDAPMSLDLQVKCISISWLVVLTYWLHVWFILCWRSNCLFFSERLNPGSHYFSKHALR